MAVLSVLPVAGAAGSVSTAGDRAGNRQVCSELARRPDVPARCDNRRGRDCLLREAAHKGRVGQAVRMLHLGASVRARNRIGDSAPGVAARAGQRRLAVLLPEHGAEMDPASLAGDTPLLLAVRANRRGMARVLPRRKVDPDFAECRCMSPPRPPSPCMRSIPRRSR